MIDATDSSSFHSPDDDDVNASCFNNDELNGFIPSQQSLLVMMLQQEWIHLNTNNKQMID
jgi:hypothetical protein